MKRQHTFSYKNAVFSFIVILAIFFTIVVAVIVSHEQEMLEQTRKNARGELELIGTFAREAILRNDYATVEQFLEQWGEEHPEITELKAVTPNRFVLARYARRELPMHPYRSSTVVRYAGRNLVTLEMIRDLSPVRKSLNWFILRLIAGSIVLTVLTGITLWYSLRRLALAPLEREIAMREEAEKKFRTLLESAPDAMVFVDRQGKITLVNAQAERLFGYGREDLEGKEIERLMPERFGERHRKEREQYYLDPRSRPMGVGLDLIGLTKDGKEFPVDISLSPVETAEGLFVLADIRDITERKRAEGEIKRGYVFQSTISRLLQTSLEPIPFENQLSLILDTILSIPFLLQPKGCIYLAEDSTLKMKVQRGLPREMLSACAEVPFGRCLCGLAASTCEIVCASCVDDRHEARYEEMSPHGNYCIPIASGTRVLGVINLVLTEGLTLKKQEEELLSSVANTLAGIVERNTAEGEKRRLQEQLVLAEKLAALGRLAANVAHEIRNPLTAIGGYARRLDRHLSPETSGKNYTGIIISEVSRLEKILKNVLVYSRESSLDLERSDVNEIIEESLKIFEPVCAERSIEIRKSLAHIPEIMTDRERIKEVINNLISNAIDSMPRGGILGIITTEETLKERPYLSVKVTDTGQGIPGDKLKMIFEPFFTTKVLEQGTGLGLAISKKIVEDHGGFIGVESTVGKGSMLTFHLPYQRP